MCLNPASKCSLDIFERTKNPKLAQANTYISVTINIVLLSAVVVNVVLDVIVGAHG